LVLERALVLKRADVASRGGAFPIWTQITALVGGRASGNRDRVYRITARFKRDRIRRPAVIRQAAERHIGITDAIADRSAIGDISANKTTRGVIGDVVAAVGDRT
jgi:hypothetical protein